MHIPNSTFMAMPHGRVPEINKDGKVTGNINAVLAHVKSENQDATHAHVNTAHVDENGSTQSSPEKTTKI